MSIIPTAPIYPTYWMNVAVRHSQTLSHSQVLIQSLRLVDRFYIGFQVQDLRVEKSYYYYEFILKALYKKSTPFKALHIKQNY